MKSLILSLTIIQLIFTNIILLNIANAVPDFSLDILLPDITTQKPFSDSDCPQIITREEWGARAAIQNENLRISPVPYVIIHDTNDNHCFYIDSCMDRIRERQNYEMDVKFYNDIAFNFLIGGDGNVYEGRGWNYRGAHTSSLNPYSIGIAVIGNFTDSIPTSYAMKALNNIIRCGISINKISENYTLIPHQQIRSTSCPGQAFYAYLMNMLQTTRTSRVIRNLSSVQ